MFVESGFGFDLVINTLAPVSTIAAVVVVVVVDAVDVVDVAAVVDVVVVTLLPSSGVKKINPKNVG